MEEPHKKADLPTQISEPQNLNIDRDVPPSDEAAVASGTHQAAQGIVATGLIAPKDVQGAVGGTVEGATPVKNAIYVTDLMEFNHPTSTFRSCPECFLNILYEDITGTATSLLKDRASRSSEFLEDIGITGELLKEDVQEEHFITKTSEFILKDIATTGEYLAEGVHEKILFPPEKIPVVPQTPEKASRVIEVIQPSDSPLRNPPISQPLPDEPPRTGLAGFIQSFHCACCAHFSAPGTSYDDAQNISEPLLVLEEQGARVERAARVSISSQVSPKKPVKTSKPRVPKYGEVPLNQVFGKDLAVTYERSDRKIPMILTQCYDEIEAWAEVNKKRALTVYHYPGNEWEINEIRATFEKGEYNELTVGRCGVLNICGVVKKYLMELPNPVVPENLYETFITAVGPPSVAGGLHKANLLVFLPDSHRSTFELTLWHISRLTFILNEGNISHDPEVAARNARRANLEFQKIVTLFSFILIRPPWEQLQMMRSQALLHCDILYYTLKTGKWAEALPEFTLPERPAKEISDILGSLTSDDRKLLEAEWFWGKRSQSFVNRKLHNQPNGSFLVRSSTDSDDYILTLKFEGQNIMIPILHGRKYYGFAEPLDFPSMVSLISWYRVNSLTGYNKDLNIRLSYPIRKEKWPEAISNDPLLESWYFTVISHLCKLKEPVLAHLFKLEVWLAYYGMIHRTLSAVVKDMFTTATELIMRRKVELSGASQVDRSETIQALNSRIQTIRHFLEDLSRKVSKLRAKHRLTCGEIDILREEVKHCCGARDRRRTWLLKQGGKSKRFVDFLSTCLPYDETVMTLALRDENLWMVDCVRENATALLEDRPLGTFLIRYKPIDKHHALSIKCGNVCHIMVKYGRCQNDNCTSETHAINGFGFEYFCPRFSTLVDFVVYFHTHSLSEFNKGLETTLQFPVNWPIDYAGPENVQPIYGVWPEDVGSDDESGPDDGAGTKVAVARPSKVAMPKVSVVGPSKVAVPKAAVAGPSKTAVPKTTVAGPSKAAVPRASPSKAAVPKSSPTVPKSSPTVPKSSPTVPRASPTVPRASPTVPRASPTVPRASPTVPRASPSKAAVPRASPSKAAVPRASPSKAEVPKIVVSKDDDDSDSSLL